MNMKIISFSVALLLSAPVIAAQQTYPSPKDARIRFVDYDAHDVVTVYGKVGADTLIMFEADEQIEDLSGGDTDAWAVGVTRGKNGFFIKPSAISPATNAHIVTTKRVYSIDLKLAPKGQINYLTVWYRYPTQEAAQKEAAAEHKKTRDALVTGAPAGKRNFFYSMQGSGEIAPGEAFDDGKATFLKFAANRSMPAVYSVGEDGKEHLVNTSVKDDVLQIHKVAPKFILRAGDLVTCIFNDAYDPNGIKATTNTVSPEVERVLKGKKK